jgi:(R,R)-butanediol dehydrogenase / meso-butanediol dehydrogenase / diacetyl reductase
MKAAVFKGVRDIRVEEVAEPRAGLRDVVVQVNVCGICGTDLHSYVGGQLAPVGQIMGHEFAGRVIEIGADVKDLAIGDRLTGSPLVWCGECARCLEQRFNLCERMGSISISSGRPGAFAERLAIPNVVVDENVFKLGTLTDEQGATVEPLAVAVHAVRHAGSVRGKTVLVLGLGTIGQQVVQVARAFGARRVIGVEISQLRIETARRLGAEAVDSSRGVADALASVLGDGDEIDVVVECSGEPTLANAAITAVRAGGTMVVVAIYDEPMTLDPTLLVLKELRLQGSVAYIAQDFREAIDLLSRGEVHAEPLITHREPLTSICDAFEIQLSKDKSLKVLVAPAG